MHLCNGRISPALSARLRAQDAKLAAKEQRAQERAARKAEKAARSFWDYVDTSGGPDACHPWTGPTNWNHPEGKGLKRYKRGKFEAEGCVSSIATRVLVFMCYGEEPPADLDTTPACGNYLCCNVRHLGLTPHSKNAEGKAAVIVPVTEYYSDAAKAARRDGYSRVQTSGGNWRTDRSDPEGGIPGRA
jgi:hypothetical protein